MNVIDQKKFEIAYINRNTQLTISLLNTLFNEDQTFSALTKTPMTRDQVIEALTNLSNADLTSFNLEQLISCKNVINELLTLSWMHRDILINECYKLLPSSNESFYVSNNKIDGKMLEELIIDSRSLWEYMKTYQILLVHKKIMEEL